MAANDDRLDAMMLESMALAIRADMPFSFNQYDMAELLERTAARIKPRVTLAPTPKEGQDTP